MTGATLPGDGGLGAVAEVIRDTAAAEIVPRFRRLSKSDVDEKSPGEVVTAADRACETVLTQRLVTIADIPVVGEEAVAADPGLLDVLGPETTCWLVDPIDGTGNFASGSPDYAVMVAYVHRGTIAASWIWQPEAARMYIAERGAGATVNGRPLVGRPTAGDDGELVGVIKYRFLPGDVRRHIREQAPALGPLEPGVDCAGIEYPALATGVTDYIVYWRTLPWDHAPGVVLAGEAGCAARRPDGSTYEPHSRDSGLLVASSGLLEELRRTLFGSPERTTGP